MLVNMGFSNNQQTAQNPFDPFYNQIPGRTDLTGQSSQNFTHDLNEDDSLD